MYWWGRELFGFLFWVAAFSVLFGCPIWELAATRLAYISSEALLSGSLTLFGLVWLFGGNRIIWFSLYIVTYPFILPLRFLPKWFAKNWPILVIFLPGIRSLLSAFRHRVAVISIAVAASVISLTSADQVALYVSWAVLISYLCWHYYQRFCHTYQTTTVYSELADMLERTSTWLPDSSKMRQGLESKETPKEIEQGKAGIYLVCYAIYTALHYVAEKLDKLHRASRIDLYLMSSAVFTVALNIGVFTVIFFGVSHHSPKNFKISVDAGLTDFIAFSFCNLFMSEVSDISPLSKLARYLCVTQEALGIFAGLLVGLVLFASCRERHSRDLGLVVKKFADASNAVGAVFEKDFQLTISGVEDLLLGFSPDIAKLLIRARHGEAGDVLIENWNRKKSSTSQVIEVVVENLVEPRQSKIDVQ
jgi:hypothetical protein